MKHSKHSPIAFFQKAFITLLFFTITLIAFAQPQQRVWSLPGNEVKFNPSPTASLLSTGATYFGLPPFTASNSMTDYNGNLLFYVLDEPSIGSVINPHPSVINIYDKNGDLIDYLQFSSYGAPFDLGQPTGGLAGEIGLVPVPNSCAKYYIIVGVGALGPKRSFHPEYAILDMNKPNKYDATKKGALEYFSPNVNAKNLQNSDPSLNLAWDPSHRGDGDAIPESNRFGIAITPFRPVTQDNFLYINGVYSLIRFVVKDNGIFLDNSATDLGIADIGLPLPSDNIPLYPEMEIIDLGTGVYRLAKIDANSNVRVYDFNSSTGIYIPSTYREFTLRTSTNPLISYYGVGLEFINSGNKLYYTCLEHNGIGSTAVRTRLTGFFDLTVFIPTPPPNLFLIPSPPVADPTLQEVSYIEKGFDGKMYYNFKTQLMGSFVPESGGWATVLLPTETIQTLPDQMDGQDYKGNPIIVDYTAGTVGSTTFTSYASFTQVWTPTSNPFYTAGGPPVGTATNPITILGELVIPDKYSITIQGMTFKFKSRTKTFPSGVPTINYGARVVVKSSPTVGVKGGRLILKNLGTIPTVFTSDNLCSNGMWEGVEVWGNNAQLQIPTSTSVQGLLSMTNSTIENAYYGAFAGRKNALYNFYLPNTQGGIIQVSGSTFRNNWNDVWFNPYTSANSISYFRYTLFITDLPLNEATATAFYASPLYHAYMNGTTNISFKTCTFKNAVATSLYPVSTAGSTGIYSRNAQFFCSPALTSTSGIGTGCTFENLRYGVYALNTIVKTVTADQNIFKNCWRGTFLSNVTTATFTRNKYFIYEQTDGTPASQAAYGLYLDYCTGFKVTENKFYYNTHNETLFNDVGAQFNDYGCIVNQSNSKRICATAGYGGDEIYKNYFNEIFVGAQSQGDNSEKALDQSNPNPLFYNNPCYSPFGSTANTTTPNNVGLKFLCNDLKGVDKNDIRVTDFSSGGISGGGLPVLGNISFQQGFTGVPAGNSFSHSQCPTSTTLSDNEILEDATSNNSTNPNNFDYVYHNVDVTIYNTKPNCYSPLNLPLYTGVNAVPIPSSYSTSGTCLSKVSTGALPASKAQIALSKSNIDALNLLLEEGDAQSMINLIATGSNGAILSGLLAESPYLSDRIIIAALNKGLPAGHIKQIIIANSPVSKQVKAVLDAISLPNGIRNQINAAQTGGKSGRDLAIEQIGYNYSQKGYYSNEIVRFYLNDTLNDNGLDSIIKLAETGVISLPDNSCTVVKSYLSKGDTTMALQKANDIQAVQGVNGECAYLFTLIKLESAYDNYEATKRDATLKSELEAIASDVKMEDFSSANSILKFIFNNPYEEWIEPFHAPMHSMQQFTEPSSMSSDVKASYLTMYPNPANDVVYFDYQLPENITQATVNVYNYAGMLVQSFTIYGSEGTATQNVEGLSNGLYMFSIISNNTSIAQQKIVISK